MNRHFDFEIFRDDNEIILFRFYPKHSHVHGFEIDVAPKTWDEVYKVYYAWSILSKYKDFKNESLWKTEIVYEEWFDECSPLDQLESILANSDCLQENKFEYTTSYGDCTSWYVKFFKTWNENITYEFICYHNGRAGASAYRFLLNDKEKTNFQKYLEDIQQYMLEHSEGI